MNCPQPPPRSAPADRLVGTVVNGKYRVLEAIGVGGMGKVYRAEQLPLGRIVALKVLQLPAAPAARSLDVRNLKKRFFREASVLSRLAHPSIVTIYDYGAFEAGEGEGERYFIAMEFLAGETLAERGARGALTIKASVRIAASIARALEETHAQGLVHRDLKPSNVMLVPSRGGERVKIIDFGIVKLVGESPFDEELTIEGAVVGSPKYMAPEQFLSSQQLDRRADVWALGVVLYRMLTSKAPFDGETTGWLIHDVLNGPAPRVRALRPEAPAELDALVARCLEKSPAKRFGTMAEVAEALDALGLAAPSTGERSSSGSRDRAPRAPAASESTLVPESLVAISTRSGTVHAGKRNKVVVGVSAAAVVAIVGALSAQRVGTSPPPEPASVPALLAATAPAPAAAPIALESPSPSLSASAAPAASAPRPKAVARPKLPPAAKSSRDDDIPAVR